MELILLALALLAARLDRNEAQNGFSPLLRLLENGDVAAFLQSDYFRKLRIGGTNGSAIADALRALQALADDKNGNALSAILSGEAGKELREILSQLFSSAKRAPEESAARGKRAESENPLAPVANIADPETVYRLNRYFAEAV